MKSLKLPKSLFGINRIVCRLIAAWSLYSFSALLFLNEDYFKLEFNQKGTALASALFVLLGFCVLSLVAALIEKYNTDSWFLFVGASSCVVFWCISAPTDSDSFLFSLSVSVVYSLFLLWIFNENKELLSKFNPSKKALIIIAAAIGLISFSVLSIITCLRYKTFSSPNFDFGIFVNMFYNMKETGLPYVTSERDMLLSHFAVHISPVYYLLLPFYLIFPSPYTLQIGQAAVLLLGIIPVILLTKHYKLSNKTAILISALYAFYTALSTGCFYDIHENCFLTLFLLLTFLFFEKNKYIPMYICAFFTLGIKEDAFVYIIIFALYVIFSRKKYAHGIILSLISVAYFRFCAIMLEKYGQGMMVNRFNNLIYNQEDGLIGAIKTVFLNPGYLLTQLFSTSSANFDKLAYLLSLLLPLGFLPLCTKKASRWILLSPLLINLLTMYVYQYDIGFQYSFGIIAFLFYSAIQNSADIQKDARKNLCTAAIAFCVCFYSVNIMVPFNYYLNGSIKNSAVHNRMEKILDMIPKDSSVCASTFLLPHIADRDIIYEVQYHEGKADTDFVVLDARYSSYRAFMQTYLDSGYEEIFCEKGLIMILKHPNSSSTLIEI